jgi:flagellar biosynthetic protein FliQ
MDEDALAASVREALWVAVQVGGPIMVAMLLVGIAISLLQALTQIQEASLGFLPKLLVTGGGMLLLGPFIIGVLRAYTTGLFDRIVALGSP